jgi:hypothetical protein
MLHSQSLRPGLAITPLQGFKVLPPSSLNPAWSSPRWGIGNRETASEARTSGRKAGSLCNVRRNWEEDKL